MDNKKWDNFVSEAKILQFPRKKTISDLDMQFVLALEDELFRRLAKVHGGGEDEIPIEIMDEVSNMVDRIEELLRS